KIKANEFEPFTGPITKQDGTVWLKEGEKADIGTMLSMNFYVKGVDDQLPK
ncbi:MAG: BMP family ABC transporter substrate-binding protein, partial [Pseudomonadota bacterium]